MEAKPMGAWKPVLLALAIVLGGAGRAAAQGLPVNRGPYMELHGGANFAHQSKIKDLRGYGIQVPGRVLGRAEFESGYAVGGAVGYKWSQGRLEGELTYRRNAFDEIDWSLTNKDGTFETDGTISSFALMVNGFWDIPTGTRIVPSLGGGLGLAVVTFDDVSDADGPLFDETETGMAFQLGAGLGYEITDTVTLAVDYRFFFVAFLDPTVDSSQPGGGGQRVDTQYLNSTVWLGLRYRF